MMKIADQLTLLEETISKLNITLEYDDLKKGVVNSLGGYFTHKGKERILVHKTLIPAERIDVLIGIIAELENLDISALGLPQSIVASIESHRAKKAEALAKALAEEEESLPALEVDSALTDEMPTNMDSVNTDGVQGTEQSS